MSTNMKINLKKFYFWILSIFGVDRRKVNTRARLRREEDWSSLFKRKK